MHKSISLVWMLKYCLDIDRIWHGGVFVKLCGKTAVLHMTVDHGWTGVE